METWIIFISSAVVMSVAMTCLARLAPGLGLIDNPDGIRKLHTGAVPLVGGPSLLLVLIFITLIARESLPENWLPILWASIATVAIGAIDDHSELAPSLRLVAQLVLASLVVFAGGSTITYLGELAGTGAPVFLGWLGPWVTIAALAAAMNAFNMLDGIDGQSAGLAWVALVAVLATTYAIGDTPPVPAIAFAAALPIFLAFNFGLPMLRLPKSFLGDSGALLLGLIVGWTLIESAATPYSALAPTTILWFAAIPLFDTLYVMGYRMLHGRSPLSADRNHLHHLLVDHGLSSRRAGTTVIGTATVLAALGMAAQITAAPDAYSFLVFLGLFLVYVGAAMILQKTRPVMSVESSESEGKPAPGTT